MSIFSKGIGISTWIFLLTMVLGSGFILLASPMPLLASDQEDVSFVFAGMRQRLSRLHSGVCRMEGTWTKLDVSGQEKEKSAILKVLVAFDGEKKLRFDRTELGFVVDHASEKPSRDDPSIMVSLMKPGGLMTNFYCTNGEKCMFWPEGQPLIYLDKAGSFDLSRVRYFDVHAIGFYDWACFSLGTDFEKIIEQFQTQRIEVDKSSPSVWTLVQIMPDPHRPAQRRIRVDVEHDFTPISVEVREQFQPFSARHDPDQPWEVLTTSTTKWEQCSEVWVPVSYDVANVNPSDRQVAKLSLQLTWEKINEPIPADYFTYEDFHAPDAVGVIDSSSGKAVFVKPFRPQPKSDSRKVSQRSFFTLRIGITVGLLVCGLIILAWFRRKKISFQK